MVTERNSGGSVLLPSTVVDSSGKIVLEVLRDKHPDPCPNTEEVLSECDKLPSSTCIC